MFLRCPGAEFILLNMVYKIRNALKYAVSAFLLFRAAKPIHNADVVPPFVLLNNISLFS